MAARRGVAGCKAELLGNAKINIAGRTGGQQGLVAGQHRGDLDLLLTVVPMDQSEAGGRHNQKPDPFGRTKDEFVRTRLVAAGFTAEGPEKGAIAAIASDLQVIQSELGQGTP